MNKKGFTLVELLAVIVILAVIMLVAVTAIGPVIDKANKGAFASSAQMALSGAENAYVTDQMASAAAKKFKKDGTPRCVTIAALRNAGYFDDKGKNYLGSVLITVNATTANVTYQVYLKDTASSYIINGKDLAATGVDAVVTSGLTDANANACGNKDTYKTGSGNLFTSLT